MIEAAEFFPLNRGVACFASRSRAIRAPRRHLVAELTGVRIVMTCRAGTILKPVLHGGDGAAGLLLVALRTRHSDMRASEREARFAVARQREMRRTKLLHGVTLFTAILIRLGDELPLVHVLMAGDALCLRNLKEGVLALGNMALVAFHFGMAAFKWIHARGVLHDAKGGGLEPVHGVTNGTISAPGAY